MSELPNKKRSDSAGRARHARDMLDGTPPTLTLTDARYAAVVDRDARADGRFVYAVVTTGVFCRPSCKARTPRRDNVRLYADALAAADAGYRPCQRCTPDGPSRRERQTALVAAACRFLESADGTPALAEVAAAVGVSPHHLHRVFRGATGVTPRQYLARIRAARVGEALGEGASVTRAAAAAGHGSASRFYEGTAPRLGMAPSDIRRHGAGETLRVALRRCSLGHALIAISGQGVCAITLGDDPAALRADLRRRFRAATFEEAGPDLAELVARAVAVVEVPAQAAGLPLDIRGTAFQERVWQRLREIPLGTTVSYGELAADLGVPGGSRAVASACAANPVAVVVPCHRVLRGDGGLSGYRWGVERKRALLDREKPCPQSTEGPTRQRAGPS